MPEALITLLIFLKPRENGKIDSQPFFEKVERSTFFSFVVSETKFSVWNLFELAS